MNEVGGSSAPAVKVLEPTTKLRWWTSHRHQEPRLEQWHINHCEPYRGEWVPVPLVIEEIPGRPVGNS